MDWSDLVGKVIGLGAPILGGALGGPLGAAAGKILADALGAHEPTPAAVNTAIEQATDPNAALAAARQAESEWLTALAEIGKVQVAEVGATQRAETRAAICCSGGGVRFSPLNYRYWNVRHSH
jgi:hypothetical protein